MDEDQISHLY